MGARELRRDVCSRPGSEELRRPAPPSPAGLGAAPPRRWGFPCGRSAPGAGGGGDCGGSAAPARPAPRRPPDVAGVHWLRAAP